MEEAQICLQAAQRSSTELVRLQMEATPAVSMERLFPACGGPRDHNHCFFPIPLFLGYIYPGNGVGWELPGGMVPSSSSVPESGNSRREASKLGRQG